MTVFSKINDEEKAVEFLKNYSNVYDLLKSNKIFVLYNCPYTNKLGIINDVAMFDKKLIDYGIDEVTRDKTFYEGWNNLIIPQSPSYPILWCNLRPITGATVEYGEWYDYKVDYDTDIVTFCKDISLKRGKLTFEYNPLFIKGITNDNMPLVLDLFTETYNLTEEDMENGYLNTRVVPLDPIRSLKVNPDENSTEDIKTLDEDVDFKVDYNNKRITFDTKILKANDIVQVKYTPNLDDIGLSLAYRMSRTNEINQAYLHPNYIEYKT
jgi:hypothetical protein